MNTLINEGYNISTNNALLDISVIHDFLSRESYWAKNIPLQVLEKAINNSLCFGVYHNGKQIGFARLVTDKATFAYLADVFVLPAHRGKGISKWLVSEIHAHPEVQGLRRWMLVTADAQGLYSQFGWTPLPADAIDRYMQIHRPGVYGS